MIKSIITNLNELKKSCEVSNAELSLTIIKDLEDTLQNNGHGVGLAGNQIGYQYQVAIVRSRFGNINLINPKIIEKENKITPIEGCLSLPGIKLVVDRYSNIKIENNGVIESYEGILAVIIQHEVRHLQGFTIIDDKHRSR